MTATSSVSAGLSSALDTKFLNEPAYAWALFLIAITLFLWLWGRVLGIFEKAI